MEKIKFTFDDDFSGDASGGTYSNKLQKVNDDAFSQGKEEGYAEALQAIEKNCELILQDIKNSFSTIMQAHESQVQEMEKNTISLVMSIIHKLAPALVEKNPMEEIELLVKECLKNNPLEPRMAIRVDDRMLPILRKNIASIQAAVDYHGQIVLISEDMTNISDCRVEWTNGGAERNYEELIKSIEDVVQIFIDAPVAQDSVPQTQTILNEEPQNHNFSNNNA